MKKALVLSMIASTMIMAGGDMIEVEEPVIVIPEPVVNEGGLYLGLAYGLMGDSYTRTPNSRDPKSFDETLSSVMLQAGYKFNPYVAIEGRYWFGDFSDLDVKDIAGQGYTLSGPNAWGVYVKPMYPVTEDMDIYALLGYAGVDHSSSVLKTDAGFSWGLGASYAFTDNVAVFVDYVLLYDDDRTLTSGAKKEYTIDTVNFGVTYTF